MSREAISIASESFERDAGEVLDCACCFDSIPMSKVTHCAAETAHFFCLDCARRNAELDIGMSRFALSCMDGSGCNATFSKEERFRFLSVTQISKLEAIEQQASIREAMSELSENFVTCPFCEYGHICPSIQDDKEFRCEFPVSYIHSEPS